jgi:putative heme-binding domain-containing protein
MWRILAVSMLAWCASADGVAAEQGSASNSDRISIAVEALQRLRGVDLEANPALKSAVLKLVESTKGTPQFVELIRDFKIQGQEASLLEFAADHPNDAAGVEAIRLVLAGDNQQLVASALSGTNSIHIVQALGNTAEKSAVPFLQPLVSDAKQDLNIRKEAVHALAQTREGATLLVALAKKSELPPDLNETAGNELRSVRWAQIKAEADQVFPSTEARNAQTLPPIPELVKLKGDPARGAEVFRRETVGCYKCHQVNGSGTDFGPNLSEVGTKLAKEAVYEAILDPSAGIAFGYEAWQVSLKNGDEAYGILASETSDEIAIKAQSGIITRYKKAQIDSKVQQKTSIMPTGLAQMMSQQDLVNLVEYLSSLKKTAPTPGS